MCSYLFYKKELISFFVGLMWFYLFDCFHDEVSLCVPGWPGTYNGTSQLQI